MRRMWMAVAAAVVTAGAGRADFGGPYIPPPAAPDPENPYGPPPADKYGCHPALRKLFFWQKEAKPAAPVSTPYPFGYGAGYSGPPGVGYPGTPGNQMPGTLVFPNHQFNRGPRDYFMYEPGR